MQPSIYVTHQKVQIMQVFKFAHGVGGLLSILYLVDAVCFGQ